MLASERDDGRRDPTYLSKTARQPSDIAVAVPKFPSKQRFGLIKYIALKVQASRKLVKRTLIDVSAMKKFSF
jgi:hypothetical protein